MNGKNSLSDEVEGREKEEIEKNVEYNPEKEVENLKQNGIPFFFRRLAEQIEKRELDVSRLELITEFVILYFNTICGERSADPIESPRGTREETNRLRVDGFSDELKEISANEDITSEDVREFKKFFTMGWYVYTQLLGNITE